jgi:hypothetical protein
MRQTYRMMRLWGSGRIDAARLAWKLGRKLKRNDPLRLTDTWGRPLTSAPPTRGANRSKSRRDF